MNVQASTAKHSGESDTKSEVKEGEELQSVSEMGKVAMHYICTVGKYQQTTITTRVAHNSIVGVGIFSWQLGAPLGEAIGHTDYGRHNTVAEDHPWWKTLWKSYNSSSWETIASCI